MTSVVILLVAFLVVAMIVSWAEDMGLRALLLLVWAVWISCFRPDDEFFEPESFVLKPSDWKEKPNPWSTFGKE